VCRNWHSAGPVDQESMQTAVCECLKHAAGARRDVKPYSRKLEEAARQCFDKDIISDNGSCNVRDSITAVYEYLIAAWFYIRCCRRMCCDSSCVMLHSYFCGIHSLRTLSYCRLELALFGDETKIFLIRFLIFCELHMYMVITVTKPRWSACEANVHLFYCLFQCELSIF
jgi:hypothetical protein